MDCIFCKIANQEISTPLLYADEQVVAFSDLDPKAPQHKLIIPRRHISTLNDTTNEHISLLGHMLHAAKQLAKQLDIAESGYRTVINCNADGGQTVGHIHLHLLGGRAMLWPPG